MLRPDQLSRAQIMRALLVSGCLFMEMMDGTVVLTALPTISEVFQVSLAASGLIVSTYLLTLAALIPLSAWLAGRFGARRVFVVAIIIFTAASVACALAENFSTLLIARVFQAGGGALMVPVGRILVLVGVPSQQIVRLVGIIVWPALTAPVLAPLLGSLLLTLWGWESIFLINVPLGIAFTLWAFFSLSRERPPGLRRRFDCAGAVLLGSGLAVLTFGLHRFSDGGPGGITEVFLQAGAISFGALLLLSVAVFHLRRSSAPLLNLRVLRIPTFRASHLEGAIFWIVASAVPFLLVTAVQENWRFDALSAGVLVTCLFLGNIGGKIFVTRLVRNLPMRILLLWAFGALGMCLAFMGLLLVAVAPSWQATLLLGTVATLSGGARSLGMTGYSTLALADVPRELAVDANAFIATGQQLFAGMAVVFASVTATLSTAFSTPAAGLSPEPGQHPQYAIAMLIFVFPLLLGFIRVLWMPRDSGEALRTQKTGAGL